MKTLLACLTTDAHAKDVLSAAVPLARRFSSHLIGLHTIEALAVYPGVVIHIPDGTYSQIAESQQVRADAIHRIFDEAVENEDFVAEWRQVNAQSVSSAGRMVEAAHTADLVIMAKADSAHDNADLYHAQEHVIRHSGRPVLMVPHGYHGDTLGKSVVIGWSPTREATRAVHEALPLLADGGKAAIVTVTSGATPGHETATELARMLDRHGIEAEVIERAATRADVCNILNREALERGADMIVTGAFGHSRLYDFVIGAVTLDLMQTAEVPVLFSR